MKPAFLVARSLLGPAASGSYRAVDVKAFYPKTGVSRPLPVVVPIDDQIGTPARSVEATLDAECSSGNAPFANVTFYEGRNFSDKQIDSYTRYRMGRAATGLYYWSLRKQPSFPAAVYYDITSGSNGLYAAAVNYDNVTGFGSFKSANAYMLKLPIPSGAPNL